MQTEELHTERMTLRKLTPETYDHLFTQRSESEIMDFLGLETRDAFMREKEKHSLGLSTYNRSFTNFLMIRSTNGKVIGSCGFHTWYTEHRRAEIGYAMFSDDFKKQGLMSEALQAVIGYGFGEMDLNRIEACVATYNIPSLRLLEKMHFSYEGLLRQHYAKNGVIEDSAIYSLLREEHASDTSAAKRP